MKTVDDLTYDEVCKLLFDGNDDFRQAAISDLLISDIPEIDVPKLALTLWKYANDPETFLRPALIEKYRTTLERAMND